MKDDFISINNKIYNITYKIDPWGDIYVEHFSINREHQGKHRHYSQRIFKNLLKKHNSRILYLECDMSLIQFYRKCGFIKWSINGNRWGGFEMHLHNDNYVEKEKVADGDENFMDNDDYLEFFH